MDHQNQRFYFCRDCGTIVGLIAGSPESLSCCGKPMEPLRANSVDASQEKHVPVVSVVESIVNVKVGSAEHPMTEAHHIDWIYVLTAKGGQRRVLSIDDKPGARFALADGDKALAVFAHCNLHGLWMTEL
ncbi:MAG: desulfoferrodoxin [Succiniclasticum sp.]|jgi:superoxide reductase|nr:desulfoferrodoxin [Succiniclasticum sp.]MDY6345686.1 desulfoferrodoxin family protein [Succiniclasticum sp.]